MNLKNIMDDVSPLWGCCSFDKIKDRLIECRAKSRLPQKAETVIVACFPYLLESKNYKNINISKYAVVTDYHDVVLNRLNAAVNRLKELYPEHEFAAFADNSPIPEVQSAVIAGLGVRGLNTLLITKEYGSYVFIGEIVTTLRPEYENYISKTCISCKKCINACPSGALNINSFQKSACLSEITQKKGILTDAEEKLMKECGCVWGCDICQDVCPMNKGIKSAPLKEFLDAPIAFLTENCSIDGRAYAWRGRKVIDRNIALHNK